MLSLFASSILFLSICRTQICDSVAPEGSNHIKTGPPKTCSLGLDVGSDNTVTDDLAADKFEILRQWTHNVSGYEPLIKIGEICYGGGTDRYCLRGLVATRDIKADEVLAQLPAEAFVEFPRADATALLERIHEDPHFNSTFAAWLSVLPTREELTIPAGMTDEEIDLMQGGALGDQFKLQKSSIIDAWKVQAATATSVVSKHNISWEEYSKAHMQFSTRFWSFLEERPTPDGMDIVEVSIPTMIPFLDMANHNDNPNAIVGKVGRMAHMTANKDIPQGAEVLIIYQANQLHRADVAILHYGYVPKAEVPLLVAFDVGGAGGDKLRATGEYSDLPLTDDEHKLGGPHCSNDELARLGKILKAFPTTEREDRQMLQTGKFTDRERMLLEMRINRKAALGHVIARMVDGLKEWQMLENRTQARWKYANFNFSSMDRDPSTDPPITSSDSLQMDWVAVDNAIATYDASLQSVTAS